MQTEERNVVVCKSDAAWKKESKTAGIGWIMEHKETREEHRGEGLRRNVDSPLIAEASALLEAISQATHKGYTRVIFKSDSMELISALKEDYPKDLYGLLNDIKRSGNDLEFVVFEHLNRKDNQIADMIAKNVLRAQPVV